MDIGGLADGGYTTNGTSSGVHGKGLSSTSIVCFFSSTSSLFYFFSGRVEWARAGRGVCFAVGWVFEACLLFLF